jgi:hypothetical protein
MFACPATDDFFRSRIDHMIDLRHPLAVLASRMPWQEIEARVPGWICSLNTTGSSGGVIDGLVSGHVLLSCVERCDMDSQDGCSFRVGTGFCTASTWS